MESEVTYEGTELVPKEARSTDDEEKETGPEFVQLDNTAAIVGGEVPSTLKPKTTSTMNPVTQPAVLDCLPEGPSRAPERILVGPTDIQNLSEDTMAVDAGGPSAEDVENEVETEQEKGDPKIVGGDVENPYTLPGEATSVNPEESGKTSGATAVKGNPVPNTRARHPRAATEVIHALPALPLSKSVEAKGRLKLRMSMSGRGREKLVIFNVHGTLLDSSLLVEKYPNSKIRPTVKTKSRTVLFRPWLHAFLSRCFIHFVVAFWGSKSAAYMDEVVPTMMGWNAGGPQFFPLFMWSGKQCEAVEFQEGTPIAWGKSLSKVYEKWPQFNATNTLIIENKVSRVSCNPSSNVVISSPFYVAELDKLADDKNFLKSTLWPVLETFESATGTNKF